MSHSDEDPQYQETDPNLPFYYPNSYEYQYYQSHQESYPSAYPYIYNNDTTNVYVQTPVHHETTVNVVSSSSSQGTPEIVYIQTPPLTETFISSTPSQGTPPELPYTQTLPLIEHAGTFISSANASGGTSELQYAQTPHLIEHAETSISSTNASRGTPEVQWIHTTSPHTGELAETFMASTPSQGSPEVLTSPYNSDETLPISELGQSTSSVPATNTYHDVRLRSNIDGASLEKHLILLSSRPKIFRCIIPCCMSPELKGTQAAKAHVYRHLFGPSKPYVCRTCNVEFASERAAERHRRYQEKKFTCGICGRPFARKDARQAHEKKAKCGGSLLPFPEFQQ